MIGTAQSAEMGRKLIDAIIDYSKEDKRKECDGSLLIEVLRVFNEEEADIKDIVANGLIKKYKAEFSDMYAGGATARRFAKAFEELGKLDSIGLLPSKRHSETRQERHKALLAAIDKGDRDAYEGEVAKFGDKFEKARAELARVLLGLGKFFKEYALDDGSISNFSKKKNACMAEMARIIQCDDHEFFELVIRRYGNVEWADDSA